MFTSNTLRAVLFGVTALASSSALAATIACPVSVQVGLQGTEPLAPFCGSFDDDRGKAFSGSVGAPDDQFILLDLGDAGTAEFDLSYFGNTDPFIAYAIGVSNFTAAPLTFTFVFSSPYVGGSYDTLSASMSSSVTNGPDATVVSALAGGESFIATSILDGSDILSASVGAGCALALAPFASSACESTPIASTGVATPGSGTYGVRVSFTLSPKDVLSLNGVVSLERIAVPAPGVLALLGLALAGAGLLQRRRAA